MSVLEERVPLSESVLWTIQKRFYETKGACGQRLPKNSCNLLDRCAENAGISAWGQKIVPCYITTNPWMATQYAKVVVGYLQDMICAEALGLLESAVPKFDLEEPFYILEYGAGSGRLGFYFLKAIQKMRETLGFLRKVKLVYIMSDFTMSNIRYWMEHEKLQEFFDLGMLDCAIVDAQAPNADIHLLKRGVTLTAESVVNPMVAIGNYFFCVVAADAFLVDKQGKLSESLLTTRSPVENDNMEDVTILERVRKTFTQVPVQAATRYTAPDHPALNKVLQEYHDILATKGYATSFLLPSGVARSIEGLVRLCKNHDHILVFCGDKGYNDLSEFEGRVGYPMSVEGSFSFMANMDAMGRYFIARGGSALANPMKVEAQGDTCLAVACYTTRGEIRNLPNTYNAFQTSLSDFGPTDFYQMVHVMSVCETGQLPPEVLPVSLDLNPENRYLDPNGDLSELTASNSPPVPEQPLDTPELRLRYQSCVREADTCGYSIQQCLALLRMSHYDPYVFWQIRPRLLVLTSIALDEERNEIHHALRQVYDNYFHINEEEDLPFEIGRLAYQLHLDNYRFALEMYMESLRLFGEHYITFYNIALCHNELGEYQVALKFLDRALSINPEYTSAVNAKNDVLEQLRKQASGNAVAN